MPDLAALTDWGRADTAWVANLKKPEAAAKIVDSGSVIILDGGRVVVATKAVTKAGRTLVIFDDSPGEGGRI